MAVTSDAMYNTGTIVPSFMSTNLYYGYVPHCKKENQRNPVYEHAEISKPLVFNCCSYDTAMETDDDGFSYSTISNRLNNDSVKPEASVQKRLKTHEKLQQCQQQTAYDADTLRHRNRKRCNSDLSPASQLKRFREGGGKDHVHYGTGSTKDYGSATVTYESEALCVKATNDNLQESMITNESCCWTAVLSMKRFCLKHMGARYTSFIDCNWLIMAVTRPNFKQNNRRSFMFIFFCICIAKHTFIMHLFKSLYCIT